MTYPQGPRPFPQWQPAPQVVLPPDPADEPVPTALRVVIVLLFVNLALSVLTAVLSYVLRDQLLEYQLGQLDLTSEQRAITREIAQQATIVRVVSVAVVALLYLWLANRLLKGKRWAYRRSLMLGVFGLVGLGVLAFTTRYPLWMHVEQGAQAVILVALLVALTRPAVRSRFREIRY